MKGQWFIISAVIASGAFLTISLLFQGYISIKNTNLAVIDEDFYYNNIREQVKNLNSDCINFERNFNEYRQFVSDKLAATGYFVYMDKSGTCPTATFGVLLASERALLYENVIPEEVIK